VSSSQTRLRVLLRRVPAAGSSALVGTVTLVALTLVAVTAFEPAPAATSTPAPLGSTGSRPSVGFPDPDTLAFAPTTTTTVAPVATTLAPTPTSAAPQSAPHVVSPPTTHPKTTSPTTTKPTTPKPTTPPAIPLASHPILPPDNPAANIAETPNFDNICRSDGNESAPCISAEMQATAAARAPEGLGAMTLPTAYYASLTPPEQLFVLTNVERVERGLPAIQGLVAQLNTDAQNAAANNSDPEPTLAPPGSTVMDWASNWAEGAGPMGSNYNWMYDDGPGSGDIDCNPSQPSTCWGHRDNILGMNAAQVAASHGTLVMGAGEVILAADSPWTSDATIMALVTGTPTYTYTWAQARAAGVA